MRAPAGRLFLVEPAGQSRFNGPIQISARKFAADKLLWQTLWLSLPSSLVPASWVKGAPYSRFQQWSSSKLRSRLSLKNSRIIELFESGFATPATHVERYQGSSGFFVFQISILKIPLGFGIWKSWQPVEESSHAGS
jgi:hypothetical protein